MRGFLRGADNNAGSIDLVDDSRTPSNDRRARISRHRLFHAGAHKGRLRTDQRHRLTLHVGTHQSPVGVIVFQERDQGRRHRNQLFRRDVDVVNIFWPRHDKVAAAPAANQIADETALVIEFGIGLSHGVAAFFHR